MKQVKVFVLFLVLVILVVAAYQNIEPIRGKAITLKLDLYFSKWETKPIPIAFIAPTCFLTGIFIMVLYNIGTTFGLRRQVKSLENALKKTRSLESDLSDDAMEENEEESPPAVVST